MRRPALTPLLLFSALLSAAWTAGAVAQERSGPPADSAGLMEYVREQQRDLERYRQSRIPVRSEARGGGCDQRIGRICIWYGGEGEADFPPEPTETEQARRGFIGTLLDARRRVAHPWIEGQLVHYLVEQGDHRFAEQVARDCRIDERWWCRALDGYSLHVRGAFVEAEEAFREALELMPPEERERWTSLEWLVPEGERATLEAATGRERAELRELYWRLSDPLFLVRGNDRLTDHWARRVQLRNRAEAENPQGLAWEEDMAETLVRYGRITGWSRSQGPRSTGGVGFQLEDTRRVIGHHHPLSRGYLFPGRFLEAPSRIPPESWITAPREAWSWYAPPYAPDMRPLETQVGRFRRGEDMLVVAAYRPAPPRLDSATALVPDPFRAAPEAAEAALFLVPEDGGPAVRAGTDRAQGVLTLRAEPGRYVSSVEVLDEAGARAWRARQGVRQDTLYPGFVGVSDLLLLEEGAPDPTDLEEALPHVRPGVRLRTDERFTVIWEVYGLEVDEPVAVTLGFTRGGQGFLTRVGEFLGIVEPEEPVEITFEDAGEGVQTAFRSLGVELPPGLEPGAYTLHLRLELPGSEPIVASRPVYVEAAP